MIPPVVSEHATRRSTISNRQQGFICGSDHTVEIWFSEVPLLCRYFTNRTLQSPHSWYSTAYIHDIRFETVTQKFPPLVCVLHWCRPPHPRQSADISFYSAQKATKSCTVLHSALYTQKNAVWGPHTLCNNVWTSNQNAALLATTVTSIFLQTHIVNAWELVQYCIRSWYTLWVNYFSIASIGLCSGSM